MILGSYKTKIKSQARETVWLWKNVYRACPESNQVLPLRGTTTRRFVGHTKDVLSVAFSSDNRQIVSGSRDKTIKLWNTLGVCKYTVQVK